MRGMRAIHIIHTPNNGLIQTQEGRIVSEMLFLNPIPPIPELGLHLEDIAPKRWKHFEFLAVMNNRIRGSAYLAPDMYQQPCWIASQERGDVESVVQFITAHYWGLQVHRIGIHTCPNHIAKTTNM
jgi:hypothetical protein